MICHYSAKYSSVIPPEYHYFSSWSPRRLINFPMLARGYFLCSGIRAGAFAAISTSRYFVIDVPPGASPRVSKPVFLIMLGSYPLVCWTDRCYHHHHHHHHRHHHRHHQHHHGCHFNHFRTHCTIFWHTALSLIPRQYVCISWRWNLKVEACFGHKNLLRLQTSSRNKFSSVAVFAPQIVPWRALNDWRLRHLLLI